MPANTARHHRRRGCSNRYEPEHTQAALPPATEKRVPGHARQRSWRLVLTALKRPLPDWLVRIAKYGPGSEKFSDAQLELLELEPEVSSAEVQAESKRPAVPSCTTLNGPVCQRFSAQTRVHQLLRSPRETRIVPPTRTSLARNLRAPAEHMVVAKAKFRL
jgi:hypothetical protein